jgi:diguanylate cyclase (GGDEF)-like protein
MKIPSYQSPNRWDTLRADVRKRLLLAFVGISICAVALFGAVGYQLVLSKSIDIELVAVSVILGGLAIAMAVTLSGMIIKQFDEQSTPLIDRIHRDMLTGLANRSLLQERLAELMHGDKLLGSAFALLFMDLDRFKDVNNTLGHHIGDQLLQQVASRIEKITPNADVMARLGGDEFAILLLNTDAHGALVKARQIQDALESPVTINNMEIDIHSSIGIALYPDHGKDAEVLFRHAEVAMYNAKQHNMAFTTYTADLDSYNLRRLALVGELRSAIENQQMILHYQPKIDLASNQTVGVEALLRWIHPQHGLIPPGEFIPLAEQSDVIRQLTYWVIDEALLQCHAWRQMGYTLNVAVNLSARNLHDPGLPAKIAGLLAKWAVPAAYITLEITENAIMLDPERALKILMRLHNLGVKISIDDFGTGYSSLVYLKKLPVSQIKVDRSFVIDMNHDDDDAVIVRSTIDLGHHMDCQVVAEGVEDKETLEQLRALGCDHVQGYYLSRPLPADDITTWFGQSNWGVASLTHAKHNFSSRKAFS